LSKQFVEIDEGWTHLIATFYYVEGALYELIEDFECVNPKVRVRGEPAAPSVEYCCVKIGEKPEELMSLEEGVENEVIASYEYGDDACSVGEDPYTLLNEKIVKEVLSRSIGLLTPYTYITNQTGVEYLLAVLNNGKGYLIEGEENKITVPMGRTLFSLHTHPNNCLPSPHDVRSLSNTLMYRGIGGGVISRDCYLVLVRSGPFTEEDLMGLIRFRDALRRMRVDELNEYIGRGAVGTNLHIHTNYLRISRL
jgi:hypothetical protein